MHSCSTIGYCMKHSWDNGKQNNSSYNTCELVVSAGRGDCCFAIGYWSTAGDNCCKQFSCKCICVYVFFLDRKWLHLFRNWLLKHRTRPLLRKLVKLQMCIFILFWQEVAKPVPQLATETPQEAIVANTCQITHVRIYIHFVLTGSG